jgi:hypothetical protein
VAPETTSGSRGTVVRVRRRAAQLIQVVLTFCAVVLALGALLVALRHNVNESNAIVRLVTGFCDAVDGPFSRSNGIVAFDGKDAVTKEALVNWGIAALVYLAVGRLLARIVRP